MAADKLFLKTHYLCVPYEIIQLTLVNLAFINATSVQKVGTLSCPINMRIAYFCYRREHENFCQTLQHDHYHTGTCLYGGRWHADIIVVVAGREALHILLQ